VTDHTEIAALTARFADAVTRQDAAAFEALWTPQATWRIDPPMDVVLEASASEIAQAFSAGMDANWSWFFQLSHGTVVDAVEGDIARSRSYISESANTRGGDSYHNVGVYFDVLERTPDGWRYQSRHYRYLYVSDTPLPGTGIPYPQD